MMTAGDDTDEIRSDPHVISMREMECERMNVESDNEDPHYTYTYKTIHDPFKVASFSQEFSHIHPVDNQLGHMRTTFMHPSEILNNPLYKRLDVTEYYVTGSEDEGETKPAFLWTEGLANCVGITVFDPLEKVAALYHAAEMDLEEITFDSEERYSVFNKYFLPEIVGKFKKPDQATVNLVSSYYSPNIQKVIQIMTDNGFSIHGISIPNAAMEEVRTSEDLAIGLNTYIDRYNVPPHYLSEDIPTASLWMNTETGEVGFQHY